MPLTVTSLDHRTGNVAPVIDAGHYRVSTQPRPTADVVTERLHASVRYIYRAAMPRLELFAFRYRNAVTGK